MYWAIGIDSYDCHRNALNLVLFSQKEFINVNTIRTSAGKSDDNQIHFNLMINTGNGRSKQKERGLHRVIKIMREYEDFDKNMFFRLKTGNKVTGHSWVLAKEHFKLDIIKYAFSHRTVNEWHKLPGEFVNLCHKCKIIMFKNKLDDYFKR